MSAELARLLERSGQIARAAGREILEVYAAETLTSTAKADDSPLTAADLRSHRLITQQLAELTPGIPVLSEEAAQAPLATRREWPRYWLVDPLDGTREFLARNGEFTVNIALIERHAPVLGVVHVPVSGVTYSGVPGAGAWRQQAAESAVAIRVAAQSAAPVRIVGSRSHRGDSLDTFLSRVGPHALLAIGSSLKFCLVAEGAADVYPRLGPTSEWDTAAAHAVVLAAGGAVRTLDGAPLQYNTRETLLNPFFVASGPEDRDWLALLR
ncbi:MAG: 3'(2'),5'-bisphosphate nucleotidase CysQ [Gammaproteobacteria bacterium]|nr:3'(2'),5'-bisphosphate nucleotidase CysQ [Gammaproteobacteria bacterium]MBV9724128.1 3'(2'),5'-bisphosphate nucleotidase CysQ [Gammaproteobacteria bacterium]